MQKEIFIKGARENNLKNIDVTIPRDKLVVLTGLSGSGKSSLAFDTIYAEGQRRYVESLSSYARMFLGQMDKPDVDYIDGLSPVQIRVSPPDENLVTMPVTRFFFCPPGPMRCVKSYWSISASATPARRGVRQRH